MSCCGFITVNRSYANGREPDDKSELTLNVAYIVGFSPVGNQDGPGFDTRCVIRLSNGKEHHVTQRYEVIKGRILELGVPLK